MSMFVAVVVRKDGLPSSSPDGQWAAFMAEDQDAAIQEALEAIERWGYQYKVLVGQIDAEVVPNRAYQVKPLPAIAENEDF